MCKDVMNWAVGVFHPFLNLSLFLTVLFTSSILHPLLLTICSSIYFSHSIRYIPCPCHILGLAYICTKASYNVFSILFFVTTSPIIGIQYFFISSTISAFLPVRELIFDVPKLLNFNISGFIPFAWSGYYPYVSLNC